LEELKKALDNNWEGYEYLQKAALKSKHKYGNGDLETDNYAAAILRFISDTIAGWRNSHGGRLGLEVHSARQYILHGKKSKATPDGRKAGEETSKNASPTPGADVNGVTALIRSATTLDASLPTVGFNLDVMLHPSAVQGEDGLLALQSLVTTYMKNGGASIHFNIFNPETLRDAQKHPEKYKNLQIRVCGWNILWNNMPKIEQDAYILRAENII
jgi:formate C-acetyltransferase